MKKKIVIGIIIFCILQVIKGLMIYDCKEAHGTNRIEYTVCSEGEITYENIKRSDVYRNYLPIMLKQKIMSVEKLSCAAKAIGTIAEYKQLENLILLEGSFIMNSAVEEARNVVVISDQASIEMFGSAKGVGRIINCNGMPYKVVGVYKKYAHLYEHRVDDGYETIYIPVTAEELKEIPIKQVIINGEYIEKMPNSVELRDMGLSEEAVREDYYACWVQETNSISGFPIIAIGILVWIICLKKMQGYNKRHQIWQRIKEERELRLIIKAGIPTLIAGVITFFIFYFCISRLNIRAERLPVENIFDIKFYWKQLCQDWIRNNLYRMESISKFGQLLQELKRALHGINLMQYIIAGLICYEIKFRSHKEVIKK